ncbi:MAG TPA: hypothetical protein VEX68_02215 [Bryobacteraceae bacterium]|nr:hypothetical protein [Bryobacteraceae bacterium]
MALQGSNFTITVLYPKTGQTEPATSNPLSEFGPHEFQLTSPDFSSLGPPEVICTEDATGHYDVKLILQNGVPEKEPDFKLSLEYPQNGKGPGSTPTFSGPGSHLAMLSESADLNGIGNPAVETTQDKDGNINIKFMLRKHT